MNIKKNIIQLSPILPSQQYETLNTEFNNQINSVSYSTSTNKVVNTSANNNSNNNNKSNLLTSYFDIENNNLHLLKKKQLQKELSSLNYQKRKQELLYKEKVYNSLMSKYKFDAVEYIKQENEERAKRKKEKEELKNKNKEEKPEFNIINFFKSLETESGQAILKEIVGRNNNEENTSNEEIGKNKLKSNNNVNISESDTNQKKAKISFSTRLLEKYRSNSIKNKNENNLSDDINKIINSVNNSNLPQSLKGNTNMNNLNILNDDILNDLNRQRNKIPSNTRVKSINSSSRSNKQIQRKKATLIFHEKKKIFIPPKRTRTFLTDEIVYQFKQYTKKKEKLSAEELENFPEFKVEDYFTKEKLDEELLKKSQDTYNNLHRNKSRSNSNKKKRQTILPKIENFVSVIDLEYQKIDKKFMNKLKEIKTLKGTYTLEEYQECLMNALKDNISTENLRNIALSFREIAEKNLSKENNNNKVVRRRMKGPKSRWEITLEKIAPYIPEYLYEKLKSIK